MSLCLIDPARAAQIFIQNLHHGLRAGRRARVPLVHCWRSPVCSPSAAAGDSVGRIQLSGRPNAGSPARTTPICSPCTTWSVGWPPIRAGNGPSRSKLNDQSSSLVSRPLHRDDDVARDGGLLFTAGRSAGWETSSELRRRRRALLKEAEQRQDLFALTNYRTEVMSYDLLADDDPCRRRARDR